jgi:hypothetical protein
MVSLWRGITWLGGHALAILTSRSVVVICTSCAILYAGFWGLAVLQANGLISTALPIPVSDSVVLQRAGGNLQQSSLSPQEAQQRDAALAQSQTAPSDASNTGTSDSPFTLDLQTAPPVELWVSDDKGGQVGTNPETGLVRLQLADASYSGRGSSPQLVSIPHALGQYHVQLLGAANGQFQLTVRVFRGDDIDHAVQFSGSGQVFEDTLLETLANVGQDQDGAPTLAVTPVQVLVAGKAPESLVAGVAAPAPDAASPSPVASDSPQPSPAVPPLAPLPRAVVAAPVQPSVVRPRPVAALPVPLPPAPALPQAIVNAVDPLPANVPPPSYGTASRALQGIGLDFSVRDALEVPKAILRASQLTAR